MAKGYWIGAMDIEDFDAYKSYIAANADPLGRYGARFLVRGGDKEVVEGQARSRMVAIEIDSYQAALDCYNSPEYQAAKALRDPIATGDMVIIQGYDG